MLNRLFRPILIIYGFVLLVLTAVMIMGREPIADVMIVSSNFRDYDQALYLMTPEGVPLQRLTRIPGPEWPIAPSRNGEWLIVQSAVNLRYYSVHIPTGDIYPIGDTHQIHLLGWPPIGDRMMYSTSMYTRSGPSYGLFCTTPTGEVQRVIESPTLLNTPLWSPDGAWFYYATSPIAGEQVRRIYRLRGDCGEVETVATTLGHTSLVAWSPDGKWLYYHVTPKRLGGGIVYRMRADGSQSQALTTFQDSVGVLFSTRWSPDGKWLYYASRRNEQTEIYRLNGETGQEQQLTDFEDKDHLLGWSANGEWLYDWNQHHPSATLRVYRMRLDGSGKELVYSLPTLAYSFAFHQRLGPDPITVFATTRPEMRHTYVMLTDGTTPPIVHITEDLQFVGIPPTGKWVIFVDRGRQNPTRRIYRVNLQTGQQDIMLADVIRFYERPYAYTIEGVSMSPDNQWIYYEVVEPNGRITLKRMQVDGTQRQTVHQVYGDNSNQPILLRWIPAYLVEFPRWRFAGAAMLLIGLGAAGKPLMEAVFGRLFRRLQGRTLLC